VKERSVLEYAAGQTPHRVDRERGIIHGVKVLGLVSANGPKYRAKAIADAAKLYDGAQVFVGHPDRSRPDAERAPSDMFGWLESPEAKADGLYADLHYVKAHAMAGTITEIAERRPDKMGLSHNAVVTESANGREVVFESINRVRSVDLVCKPATTRGIFESEGYEMDEASAPVAPAVSGGGDMTWEMFASKAKEIFDGDTDAGQKAKAIGALAKTLLKVAEDIEAATETPAASEPPAGETAATESQQGDKLERALSVLEAAGVTSPSPMQIRVVAALDGQPAHQRQVAETWKPAATSQPKVKPRSGSVLESQTEAASKGQDRKAQFNTYYQSLHR
jgi:hypothetical protein